MTDVVDILKNKFKEAFLSVQETKDEFLTLWISADYIIEVLAFLKSEIDLPYKM